MASEARVLANLSLDPEALDGQNAERTTAGARSIVQNEPNLQDAELAPTSVWKRDYGKSDQSNRSENEPNFQRVRCRTRLCFVVRRGAKLGVGLEESGVGGIMGASVGNRMSYLREND